MSFTHLFERLARRTSSGRFIPVIDGLRFISITLVFLYHLGIYLTAKSAAPFTVRPGQDWLTALVGRGAYGVELFFVISGFVLGLPFAKQYLAGGSRVSLRRYFWRRITRLEPPYIVCLTVFFVLLVVINGESIRALAPHALAGLGYVHNLLYGSFNPINRVAWSLEIEVQFYILAPLLAMLFCIPRKHLRRAVLLALTLGAVILQQRFMVPHSRPALSLLNYIQYFLAGFVLADVFVVDWKEGPQANRAWDVVTLLGWPALFWVWVSTPWTPWVFPFATLLLFAAAFRGRSSSQVLGNRWLTTIGGMCYSIYLIHYTFISVAGRMSIHLRLTDIFWVNLLLQIAIVAPLTLVASALYFVTFERPFMDREWPAKLRKWLWSRAHVASAVEQTPEANVRP
jgi:peptidoglycan/LPS O-acetylase OafA/YrhL